MVYLNLKVRRLHSSNPSPPQLPISSNMHDASIAGVCLCLRMIPQIDPHTSVQLPKGVHLISAGHLAVDFFFYYLDEE
jgi:hypothetical protein